jgi:HlyD family secretion protein
MNKPLQALWKVTRLVLLMAFVTGCSAINSITGGQDQSQQTVSTAPVRIITAVSTVSGTGNTEAIQTVSVNWKVSGSSGAVGTVGTVKVKVNDMVKAGDVLMTMDPNSSATTEIQVQAAVSTAVKALNDLLNPTDLQIANAQKAVSDAQTALDDLATPTTTTVATAKQAVTKAQATLDTAQKTLANSKSVNMSYYQDQLNQAQSALTNAQQSTTITDIGSLPVQLRQAQDALVTATNVYNNAKDAFAKCPLCITVWAYNQMTDWPSAQNQYNDAVNRVNQIQIQIDQAQRQNSINLTSAQEALTTAQNNLKSAYAGPDGDTVAQNTAAVAVAQGALADAQKNLNTVLSPDPVAVAVAKATLSNAQTTLATLQNPDPVDVLNAQAKVSAALSALSAFTLTAPVDGQVLEVNYQPGDLASSSTPAVVIANRSSLRVQAQVDESQVAQIKVGNPVTLTMNAVPGLSLPATVTYIDAVGVTSQGLVKYNVQVDSTKNDPRVLLGMTTNVLIVTNRQAGQLAVPLQALQYDTDGEFVNTVAQDGVTLTRVPVVSGQIQGSYIVVSGTLKSGEQVELPVLQAATTTNRGLGGGFGGITGGGGGGGPVRVP